MTAAAAARAALLDARRSHVTSSFRMPPIGAEIPVPDKDPDVNEVNQLLAQLARTIRWFFGLPNNAMVNGQFVSKGVSSSAYNNANIHLPRAPPSSHDPEKQAEIEKIWNGMVKVQEQLSFVMTLLPPKFDLTHTTDCFLICGSKRCARSVRMLITYKRSRLAVCVTSAPQLIFRRTALKSYASASSRRSLNAMPDCMLCLIVCFILSPSHMSL